MSSPAMERPAGASPRTRGRAAGSNAAGRFDPVAREGFDDGWEGEEPRRLDTTVTAEAARTIITRNDSPDLGFDRTINPYRGCEHGCIYCYARPTHAYLDLSPGLDFETKLFFKKDAARLLEAELARADYRARPIQLGASTDCYQPIEGRLRTTRGLLEVLSRAGHPATVTTKGILVTRDIDILAAMAGRGLASVTISVTTLDRALSRRMEPRASAPGRRLDAIRALSAAGVPVTVGVAPVIPALNDHEIEGILERAADAGASTATYTMLRLPREVGGLFRDWLAAERPERAARVMSLVRQMRGGKEYDAEWGRRMTGQGPLAEMAAKRFEVAARRFGLGRKPPSLRTDLFRPPAGPEAQLDLF